MAFKQSCNDDSSTLIQNISIWILRLIRTWRIKFSSKKIWRLFLAQEVFLKRVFFKRNSKNYSLLFLLPRECNIGKDIRINRKIVQINVFHIFHLILYMNSIMVKKAWKETIRLKRIYDRNGSKRPGILWPKQIFGASIQT